MKELTELQWKWADILIKGFGVAIITAAISLFSIMSKNSQEKIARDDRKAQQEIALAAARTENTLARNERQLNALVQFASAQKKIDVDVGMGLFKTFMEDFLKLSMENSDEIKQSIVMLRLIVINFQDVPINLKPLFEYIDVRLAPPEQTREQTSVLDRPEKKIGEFGFGGANLQVDSKTRRELREQLRNVAKEVANRQAFRMTFLGGNLSDEVVIGANDVIYFLSIPFAIQVVEIARDKVRLLVKKTELDREGEPTLVERAKSIGPFWLSYYDMPLLDNIKINSTTRISVILQKIEGDKAIVRMLDYQSDLAADRFDVKEISREIVKEEL